MFSGRYPSVGAARREAADGLSHRIRTEFYAPDAQHRHQGGPACRHHHQPCQPGFGTPERGSQGAARLCHGSRPRRRGVHRRDVARRLPGPRGPGREFGLQGPDQAEFQWIIDPLDGTTNFIHGLPNYAVSIALTQRGRHAGVHLRSVAQRTIHRQPWRRHLPERPPRARLGPHPLPRRAAGRPLAQLGRHGAGLGAFPQDGRKQRRRAPPGRHGAGSGLRGLRSPGRFLRRGPEALGCGRGQPAGAGSGRRSPTSTASRAGWTPATCWPPAPRSSRRCWPG